MHNYVSGKLSSKGQLTIPSELREQWGLQEGDKLKFTVDEMGNVQEVVPIKKKSIKHLFGALETNLKYDQDQAREIMHKEISDKVMSELKGD